MSIGPDARRALALHCMSDASPIGRACSFWRRVLRGPSPSARLLLYEELAPTMAAGIGIREGLRLTADRNRGAGRRAVELLESGLNLDVALSATMRAHPDVFSPIEAALVATGERTGRLDAAFRSAAAQIERERAMRNRLLQAFLYPLFLVHALVLMVGVLRMTAGNGSFVAFVLTAFAVLWLAILGSATLLAAFSGEPAFARAIGRVPVIGTAVRRAALARFARSFAALHGAGVGYEDCLRTSAAASGNALLGAQCEEAALAVRRGEPLSAALARVPFLPGEDRGLLVSGEQSGALEESARRLADLEDERFDVATKRAIALLPPILVILVGAAVFWFAYGALVPRF